MFDCYSHGMARRQDPQTVVNRRLRGLRTIPLKRQLKTWAFWYVPKHVAGLSETTTEDG